MLTSTGMGLSELLQVSVVGNGVGVLLYNCMAPPIVICLYLVAAYCSRCLSEKKKEMFYLTTHSTHFIYGYMASDIW